MKNLTFGIDIVKIERIAVLIERYENKFLKKIFSGKEIAEAKNKSSFAESIAGKFAAKEAYIKTLSSDELKQFSWLHVEILSDDSGKPHCFYLQQHEPNCSVSISHERMFAIAGIIRLK